MAELLLGLDVSTSFCGAALIDLDVPILPGGGHIVALEHIAFKGCNTIWEKADRVVDTFATWTSDPRFVGLKTIVIEDAAKRFTPGKSSADTIATLLRFNGLATYFARQAFKIEPTYMGVGEARKRCGLKMQRVGVCGKSHKEQTWDAMSSTDLAHVTWPLKQRSTNIVDWSKDVTDAYVIARAARALLGK